MSTLSIEQVGLWNKDFLNLEWTATTESYLIVLVTYEGLPGAANSSSVFAINASTGVDATATQAFAVPQNSYSLINLRCSGPAD